ncbi:MAG: NAD(P)H-hydrate dehydratase, partial [Owenweeksia sp.]
TVNTIDPDTDLSPISEGVVVDALLGSGLNRPLKGLLKDITDWLNKQNVTRVSIDIPTGLFAENNYDNELKHVLNAHETLSLQMPKRSFFHRNTAPLVGGLKILDIGLHPDFIKESKTDNYYFDRQEACLLFRPRKQHSFKGTYGHALLVAGSQGKIGAAILSARAVMRSGAGLLTVHTPGAGLMPLQGALPEAMVSVDENEEHITGLPESGNFKAIGMGPGVGTASATSHVLKNLIQNSGVPMVLDADALNILAENRTWLAFLPQSTILTPHIGEFRRLLGKDKLEENYLDELRTMALRNGVTIVLKDSNTAVASPDGSLHFINSGSPALATAGSGDVLTGVILGLLS